MATQSLPLQERDPNTAPASSEAPSEKSSKCKSQKSTKSSGYDSKKPPTAADLSHIHLAGEEEEKVPIFDTCDDIRKKINDHLKGSTNQTAFSRELNELLPYDSVNQRQLANFLKFKGARAGAHSPVFYSAYVYFEKLRLQQGKKKSAKREKVEEVWKGEGGIPREGSHNMHAFCFSGESWKLDALGQFQLQGAPNGRPGLSRKKARSR